MSRTSSLLLLIILWALIYLPGLGSTEIKGEEGRRILPAIAMLDTGDWLVPHLNGERYLRKPPLINWLIAGSFSLTGIRSEWTARLPSAAAVLLMGLTILALCFRRGWMDLPAGFAAALLSMTSAGLLAKARFAGAEIEGVYASLFGIAIAFWLAWRAQEVSPWLTWLVPSAFLGLGLLAKGPIHLACFYLVALAVCYHQRRLRDLLHPAHFAGIALMLAIAAAWVVPLLASPAGPEVMGIWKSQGVDRFSESDFNPDHYWSNLPRWLSDLLPWLLLFPSALLIIQTKPTAAIASPSTSWAAPSFLGAFAASAIAMFIPGMLPRYVLPLSIPCLIALAFIISQRPPLAAWHRANQVAAGLLALAALAAPAAAAVVIGGLPDGREGIISFRWQQAIPAAAASTFAFTVAAVLWSRRNLGLDLTFTCFSSGAILAAASLLYAATAVPWINRTSDLRSLARQIDRSLPPGAELLIYRANYQPVLFYLKTPHRHFRDSQQIPANAPYILVPTRDARRLAEKRPDFVETYRFKRKNEPVLALFQPTGAHTPLHR